MMEKYFDLRAGLFFFFFLLLLASFVLAEEQEGEIPKVHSNSGGKCNQVSECGNSTVALCCSGSCFDRRKWNCVEGRVCNITSTVRCAGVCYEPNKFSCHFNRTLCKIGWNLCNRTCYDPKVQYCANDFRICTQGQWYCAESDRCYDPQTQFCCASRKRICLFLKRNTTTSRSLPSPSPHKSGNMNNNGGSVTGGGVNVTGIWDFGCCPVLNTPATNCSRAAPLRCGTKCYNPGTSACVNGRLVCKLGNGVCGDRCYNTSAAFCPDSVHLCLAKQWYCPEAGKCFDPLTQLCCAKEHRVCLKKSSRCCAP